jgi:hypothetical protein
VVVAGGDADVAGGASSRGRHREIADWWERVVDAAVAGGSLPAAVVAGVGEELADGAGFGGGGQFAGVLPAVAVAEQFADDLPA